MRYVAYYRNNRKEYVDFATDTRLGFVGIRSLVFRTMSADVFEIQKEVFSDTVDTTTTTTGE